MFTNLCGGFLSSRYSSKAVLGLGVVVWSLFTMATPAAAGTGCLTDLLLARGMMGLGEGVTYPAIHNLVRRWVPAHQRSQALGLISSGACGCWRWRLRRCEGSVDLMHGHACEPRCWWCTHCSEAQHAGCLGRDCPLVMQP